jgi:hypothetical protein
MRRHVTLTFVTGLLVAGLLVPQATNVSAVGHCNTNGASSTKSGPCWGCGGSSSGPDREIVDH